MILFKKATVILFEIFESIKNLLKKMLEERKYILFLYIRKLKNSIFV